MLTLKQEAFTQCIFKGMTQRKAWIEAGYSHGYPLVDVDAHACNLANTDKIKARYKELLKEAEDATVADHLEACQVSTAIIRAKVSDFLDDTGKIDKTKLNSHAIQSIDEQLVAGRQSVVTKLRLHNPLDGIEKLARLKKWYNPEGTGETNIRILNINVKNEETKQYLGAIADRTKKLEVGDV